MQAGDLERLTVAVAELAMNLNRIEQHTERLAATEEKERPKLTLVQMESEDDA